MTNEEMRAKAKLVIDKAKKKEHTEGPAQMDNGRLVYGLWTDGVHLLLGYETVAARDKDFGWVVNDLFENREGGTWRGLVVAELDAAGERYLPVTTNQRGLSADGIRFCARNYGYPVRLSDTRQEYRLSQRERELTQGGALHVHRLTGQSKATFVFKQEAEREHVAARQHPRGPYFQMAQELPRPNFR